MNISATDQIGIARSADGRPNAERLKNAAVQFEALLLMQLTSALNGTSGNDEDSLFGSDAGSGLAKQLFSEQMATTLAQSGGFGISEIIMQQLGGKNMTAGTGGIKSLPEIVSAVKGLSENNTSPIKTELDKTRVTVSSANRDELVTGDPKEAQIISTFEDDLKANGIDESLKNLMLDGRVVNSTRARFVPNAPVINLTETSVDATAAVVREVEFQKPVAGRISSEFGNRFHPIDRRTKFHGGLDIAVPTGTLVSAAAEGTVVFAGKKGGYGNLVIIDHPDGRQTRYAHLASISVSEGNSVTKGQPIAFSGSTGKSTGPHLHFEMRENGVVVDPRRILSNVLPRNAER